MYGNIHRNEPKDQLLIGKRRRENNNKGKNDNEEAGPDTFQKARARRHHFFKVRSRPQQEAHSSGSMIRPVQ